ncbi:MAG: right-handed parallel beta-helix repeat-containing protein [Roseiflexaceae bacterium]|nr:right-handed parallel beta-helix repeat-containing protein [Roseiflexaceae bacterium]
MSRFPSALPLFIALMIIGAPLLVGPAAPVRVAQASGVFVVTTAEDVEGTTCPVSTSGDPRNPSPTCSLRQAIKAANKAGGGIIKFQIPPVPPAFEENGQYRAIRIRVRNLYGPLPALEGNITIDGKSQEVEWPAYANLVGPEIIIDGSELIDRSGIRLIGQNNVVREIAVVNFKSSSLTPSFGQGVGIDVVSGSNHRIEGCYVGIDPVSPTLTLSGNGFAGIWVEQEATDTVIGGSLTDTSKSNFISGNNLDGIVVQGTRTRIQGNFIGVGRVNNTMATFQLRNLGAGIIVRYARDTIIGATSSDSSPIYGNVISGNNNFGIVINGGTNVQIAGNYIGFGSDADSRLIVSIPNAAGGIEVHSEEFPASNIDIGLPSPDLTTNRLRNFIAGNTGPGIALRGDRLNNIRIVNNYIGLNDLGQPVSAPNNTGGGIVIERGARNITVGGATLNERNVISGNTGDGIVVRGRNPFLVTQNNTIIGNYIGTNVSGSLAGPGFANRSGIVIGDHAYNTVIGQPGAPNQIGFNSQYGVAITGTNVLTTTLTDNVIVRNGLDGVYALGAVNLSITGATTSTLIAANGRNGVWIDGGQLITIENATLFDNGDDGARLANVARTTLRNVVATQNDDGIDIASAVETLIENSQANTNRENGLRFTNGVTTTLNNLMFQQNQQNGLSLTGVLTATQIALTQAISNTLNGFLISGATDGMTMSENTITGSGAAGMALTLTPGPAPVRDVIVFGNTLDRNAFLSSAFGIQISGGTEAVTVTGNFVDGTRNGGGVLLPAANRMTLSDNVVQYNNGPGFRVENGSDRVIIERNTIVSNTIGVEVRGSTTISTVVRSNNITLSGATGWGATGSGVGVAVSDAQRTLIETNSIVNNLGAGVHVSGAAVQTQVVGNEIFNNALGVLVGAPLGGPLAPPYPQQTRITSNRISGNGIPPEGPFPVPETLLGRGIVLNPETPTGGVASNPNNDIDPPLPSSLRMSAAGRLTGQVDTTNAPGGCPAIGSARCLIQVFRPDQITLDGQGRELAGERYETVVDATGAFTVEVGGIPRQLTLTATDPLSNTSRFAIFSPRPLLSISPPQAQTADPGQVITYTHTLVNNGNIELQDVRISVTTSRGWQNLSPPIAIQPAGSFALAPGESRPITISVRVPTGGGPQAAPGTDLMTVRADGTTVSFGNTYTATASLVNTTTVNPRIYLELTPASVEGRGNPGVAVPYSFQVRNTGNISATTSITATFDDPVFAVNWQRALSATSLTIPPGETRAFQLTVTVPPESANPIAGTFADVTVNVTPTDPVDPPQARTAKARTIVGQVSRARITPASAEKEGAPGETVTFLHEITNLGNGTDTFQIRGIPALGSQVRFTSLTSGVSINSEGRFTMSQGATAIIRVEVTVNPRLANGNVENVFIELRDLNGNVIGGAFAQDRVRVVSAIRRVYLPLVVR